MKKELIERSGKLLEELKELSHVYKLLSDKKHGDNVNFVIKQHHGDTYMKDYERVVIDIKHTPRLLSVVRDIINEIEEEIKSL